MIIDISADGHIHTNLCRHATGTMEDYVISAVTKGFKKITFMEHMEEGIDYFERTWLREEDFDYYFAEGERLREIYGEKLTIALGVEVGFNPDAYDRLLKRLEKRTWDQIGLSYHFCKLPGCDMHLNLLSRKKKNITSIDHYGADKLLSHYFDTLISAVSIIPANVLCHLDAGLRNQPNLQLTPHHHEQIEHLLEEVKLAAMALEVNTSGFPQRNEPFPQFVTIIKAIKMGIPLLAGSDAHKPEDIGRFFDTLPQQLNSYRWPE